MTEKNTRNHNIHAKIASEGYCCVWGFLNLCKARGQTPRSMMNYLGLSHFVYYVHNRKLEKGLYGCESRSECLKPTIWEIKGYAPPDGGEVRSGDSCLGSSCRSNDNPDAVRNASDQTLSCGGVSPKAPGSEEG